MIEEPEVVETQHEYALRDTERRRLAAYADPETGSDRHFAEASRLDAVGRTDDAGAARQVGIARYQEIRDLYPWPEDTEEGE